jgi:hypothetical protein
VNSPRCKIPTEKPWHRARPKLAPDSIFPEKTLKGARGQKKSLHGPNFAILDSTVPMAHRQIFPVFFEWLKTSCQPLTWKNSQTMQIGRIYVLM